MIQNDGVMGCLFSCLHYSKHYSDAICLHQFISLYSPEQITQLVTVHGLDEMNIKVK